MVTFDGLTKHFLMILVEFFLIIYNYQKYDFGNDNEEIKDENEDKKTTVALWH